MERGHERVLGGMTPIYWSMIILLFPLSWLFAIIIAAFIHEMGHYLAVRCCGKRISAFRVGITGAILETSDLSTTQEFICTLMGPLAGFLPMLAMRWIPRIAFCAMMQSIFNLLPIYPFDGGRCLRCVARFFSIPQRLCSFFEGIALCILIILAVYGMVTLRLGVAPLLVVGVTIFKVINGKRPCKQLQHWL